MWLNSGMPDLTPQIEQAASEPKSATSDGQSATHHDLDDLIAADRYLKGVNTVTSTGTGWAGLRIARFKPPGADPE